MLKFIPVHFGPLPCWWNVFLFYCYFKFDCVMVRTVRIGTYSPFFTGTESLAVRVTSIIELPILAWNVGV